MGLTKLSVCLIALLVTVMASISSHAYIIASYGDAKLDTRKRTNVILVTKGKELDFNFLYSARMTAARIKQVNPEEQVLVIGVEERDDYEKNVKEYRANKFIIQEHKTNFWNKYIYFKDILNLLEPYKKIASLHLFSHSTPQFGALVDGKYNRIEVDFNNDWYVSQLSDNFAYGAYVYLHGCNSGFALAPLLAKAWGVPVAGSLTSSDFEKFATDGSWYFTTDSLRPADVKWASQNKVTTTNALPCYEDNCYRMKPLYETYSGYWSSHYEAGQPIYKFFCPLNSESTCKYAMIRSALHTPSIKNINKTSSFEDYKTVVKDIFCPMDKTRTVRNECFEKLDNPEQNMTYTPFLGKALNCDKDACDFEFSCNGTVAFLSRSIFQSNACGIESTNNRPSITFVKEYLDYLDAYSYLTNPPPEEPRRVYPMPESAKPGTNSNFDEEKGF